MSEAALPSARWRPLALLFAASGAGLLIVAVLDRNPVPLFLALPLLLAPVGAALAGPRGPPTAAVDFEASGAAAEVRIDGRVVPPAGIDARDLVIELERPASLVGDAAPTYRWSANDVRFFANWRALEPIITEVRPPNLYWRDPLGLVEREVLSSVGPKVVSRYPPELLRIGAVRLQRTTPLPGETRSARVGESGEFHGIRLARPEDPPRLINWRASAREGRRLANEYDLDKTGDILLILDGRSTPLGPAVDERLFSIMRAAAAGLSESFLAVKSRVGLGVFGEFLDAVPLSTGRTQRIRIESALRRARVSGASAPPERCAVSVRRHFPPGLTTVVFSSLADETTDDLTPYLRHRGYPVVVLSPSPLPLFEAASTLSGREEIYARRLSGLLRRSRVARAWQESPTIDWDDYWSLGKFVEFVRRPRVRRLG